MDIKSSCILWKFLPNAILVLCFGYCQTKAVSARNYDSLSYSKLFMYFTFHGCEFDPHFSNESLTFRIKSNCLLFILSHILLLSYRSTIMMLIKWHFVAWFLLITEHIFTYANLRQQTLHTIIHITLSFDCRYIAALM